MKITNIRLKSANKKGVKKLYFLEGIDAIEKIENNYEKKVIIVSKRSLLNPSQSPRDAQESTK